MYIVTTFPMFSLVTPFSLAMRDKIDFPDIFVCVTRYHCRVRYPPPCEWNSKDFPNLVRFLSLARASIMELHLGLHIAPFDVICPETVKQRKGEQWRQSGSNGAILGGNWKSRPLSSAKLFGRQLARQRQNWRLVIDVLGRAYPPS